MKRILSILVLLALLVGSVQATEWLKQSTAITLKLGPFLDDTDGKTAETGLTISQADVRLSKNGGDFAQTSDANAATHDENGWYDKTIVIGDVDTLGRLTVSVSESGALPVWETYMVVSANTWDSLFGTDELEVDVTTWHDDSVPEPCQPGYPEADMTYKLGTAPISEANLLQIGKDVIVFYNLDHYMHTAVSNTATIPEVVDSTVLALLMTKTDGDTSDYDFSTDSLEALAGSSAPSAAAIADAVLDEAVDDHQTAGTVGRYLRWLRNLWD